MVAIPTSARECPVADGGDGVGNVDRSQEGAFTEHLIINSSDGVGDADFGQTLAARERPVVDVSNGVGDVDVGQVNAARERQIANGGDGVGCTVMGDGGGGVDAVDVLIDAIDLNVGSRGYGWQQESQQQEDRCH